MTAPWAIEIDKRLILGDVEAWTTGMLWNEALSLSHPPSKPTFSRWLADAIASGRLRKVRAGLFLNASGNKAVSLAACAGLLRRSAVPSLSWVLEQDWILNNIGGPVTCVVPMGGGLQAPSLGSLKTPLGTFRFRALPWDVHELAGLDVTDWRDARFAHPRATPEKALCDWLYLADSPRSSMTAPPLDLDATQLQPARLRRIARAMGKEEALTAWLLRKSAYDQDPEVIENASLLPRPKR